MGEPLRVGMVIQRFRPVFSGQGIQVEALAAALARRGVEVSVLTAMPGVGRTEQRLDGYSVVRLGNEPPAWVPPVGGWRARGPTFAARVFAHLQEWGRFDLLHVHAMTDALYTSLAWCRLHDRPIVFELTLVGADDPATLAGSTNRLARVRRSLYHRCDGYVVISPALEAACRDAGIGSDRVRLIPQGVDTRTFAPVADRPALRRELGLPAAGPLVIFVGSLIHRKGIDLLLDAWSRIAAAVPAAQLVLVGRDSFAGDGTTTAFLATQLGRVSPDAMTRVHRVGLRDDVHRWLQASDLFLFPSRREGFGTAMIEAMACGLPAVVGALPGITEFIFGDDDGAGIVVPQDDPASLATAATALLQEPSRARAMGVAAREAAVARFDIDGIAGRYLAYYGELLDRGRRHPR